jgi:phytoene dehydrogenase-like protein
MDFLLDEPFVVAGQEWTRLPVVIYNFDPGLAPEGKTLLTAMQFTDYEYWKKLSEDPERYKAEKEQIADHVVAALDRRFPGLAARVEMRDVATPMTWERYTGNWKGAYEGWRISTETFGMSMDKTLPGLADFYMAGQWVMPGGGLPMAVMSGRHVTQIICNKDNKEFVASTP